MNKTRITDLSLRTLAGFCSKLEFLHIDHCPNVTSSSFSSFKAKNRKITELSIQNTPVQMPLLIEWIQTISLRALHLEGFRDQEKELQNLSPCLKTLETLSLLYPSNSLALIKRLPYHCKNLQVLLLTGSEITKDFIKHLSAVSKQLIILDLSYSKGLNETHLDLLIKDSSSLRFLVLIAAVGSLKKGYKPSKHPTLTSLFSPHK